MSIDLKMAWRNVWRNPRRTLLTLAAIGFACLLLVFMLSFQFGSYDAMIDTAVKVHTGHLQIQARGYNEKREMRRVVPSPVRVERILEGIPEVVAYTFRSNAFSLVSSEERTYGCLIIGIDPQREVRVSRIKSLIRRGRYLSESRPYTALIGESLAKNLRVDVGSELTILGQAKDGSIAAAVVTIAGIYSSGQDVFDRSAVHIRLADFQEIYGMGGSVHEVVAIARSLEDVRRIKKAVAAAIGREKSDSPLAVLDWQELMPGLAQGIKIDLISGLIMYLLLILVVAFSILNTFLMAILERTREFGVMMAMGTSPARLTRLLLIESSVIAVIGVALGVFAGTLVTLYFQFHGIDLAGASEILRQYGISGRLYPRLSLLSASIGPCAVLLITALAALVPALKVRRLRPVEALAYT